MRHVVYIGIGSNVGDKVWFCQRAISEILKVDRHRLLAKSSFFKTRPMGFTDQDWFVNGVIKVESHLGALDLFHSLKSIESRLGRSDTFRWGPRTIDLDILLFDDEEIRTPELQIPHPSMHERQFVLVPLAEIDRTLIHPVLQKTVQELLDHLSEDQGVEKILSPSCPNPS